MPLSLLGEGEFYREAAHPRQRVACSAQLPPGRAQSGPCSGQGQSTGGYGVASKAVLKLRQGCCSKVSVGLPAWQGCDLLRSDTLPSRRSAPRASTQSTARYRLRRR